MKESGKRSPAADSLVNLVDKKLEKEAKLVGEAITKFEVVSKNVLQKFNKNIIHQQFHVKRIADAALEIFASSAVLSRATASQKHPTADKETEITLAQIYVYDSLRKINNFLDEISPESEAHWDRMKDVTLTMVERDGHVGVHPTELIN